MGPEDYLLLKAVHRSAATLSIAGFLLRGFGALRQLPWARNRVARTLPHVVDTVLLASALTMAWLAGWTPANAPWLDAKIVALLVYIGLGMLALRPGRSLALRTTAFVLAVLTFGYIVSVAFTKHPLGLLSLVSPQL